LIFIVTRIGIHRYLLMVPKQGQQQDDR